MADVFIRSLDTKTDTLRGKIIRRGRETKWPSKSRTEAWSRFFPHSAKEEHTFTTPLSWTSSPQKCEKYISVV
jgi:hypothetical protein